uniref:Small ribosomal subunit protein uS11c n=1 Tax=Johnson-sea-linkia profunda TaxID=575876 RepID=A0A386AXP3_9CHLO|nr:ribosomal protein S11 [Johnson-sea-linkia profunda]
MGLKCQASNQKKSESKRPQVLKDPQNVIIHIKATFNNTLLTLTNFQGQVLTWASAGSCGFKGTRKGTPFAAKKVVEIFIKKSHDYLVRCHQIKICVCGFGPGRENALRGLSRSLGETLKQEKKKTKKKTHKITLIREGTKLPHNGCRPPKKRRL